MYTKIPNHIFELLPTLSGVEVKVLMAIYRHTAGWQRESATLSLSMLAKLTGASIRQISSASSALVAHGLVTMQEGSKGRVYTVCYSNNCNTEAQGVEIIATEVLQKLPPYKERKESNTTSDDVVQESLVDVAPSAPKAKRTPKTKEPKEIVRNAMTVFREIHRLSVPIAIRGQVESQVDDIDRWEVVCREWIAKGYRPGNVAGCLQVYREGWKNDKSRRQTQRGDIQRQQRESLLGERIAEFEREDSTRGDWGDS
jgi:phage replication O-like protein O